MAAPALGQAGAVCSDKARTSHAPSNIQGAQVSLIGEHSDFVCSGSDGGSIFIWNAQTGQLVNVLRANETVTTCVAPHPHVPMLASCGFEPAVRLWSPEVGGSCGIVYTRRQWECIYKNAVGVCMRGCGGSVYARMQLIGLPCHVGHSAPAGLI